MLLVDFFNEATRASGRSREPKRQRDRTKITAAWRWMINQTIRQWSRSCKSHSHEITVKNPLWKLPFVAPADEESSPQSPARWRTNHSYQRVPVARAFEATYRAFGYELRLLKPNAASTFNLLFAKHGNPQVRQNVIAL
jgi:hypothetical protein